MLDGPGADFPVFLFGRLFFVSCMTVPKIGIKQQTNGSKKQNLKFSPTYIAGRAWVAEISTATASLAIVGVTNGPRCPHRGPF